MNEKIDLAPTGSTGNNTHAGVHISGYDSIVLKFIVEASAAGTVTYKFQASVDDSSVSDANASWFDVGYITDASDTISQATRVRTTAGADIEFLSNPVARKYRRWRLVTSANTAVTYRAEAYRQA